MTEAADEGIDTVWSTESYTLPDHTENLQLRGAGILNGTGNDLDNIIVGNGSSNVLDGKGGDDSLFGGPDSDTLTGGSGNDHFVFDSAPTQFDLITDFTLGEDRIVLAVDIFTALTPDASLAANFRAAADLPDGDDFLVYDQIGGFLHYDVSGSSSATASLPKIARVDGGTALTAADLLAVDNPLAAVVDQGGLVVTQPATAIGSGAGWVMSSSGGFGVALDIDQQIVS